MLQEFTSSLFSNNEVDTEMCLSGFVRHRYLPHLNEKNHGIIISTSSVHTQVLKGFFSNSNDIPDLLEMLGIISYSRPTFHTLSVNKI